MKFRFYKFFILLPLLFPTTLSAAAPPGNDESGVDEAAIIHEIESGETAPQANALLRIETGMHTSPIENISVDANGRYILTTSPDKTLRLWNAETGNLTKILRVPIGAGLEGQLFAGAISPDGAWVAGAGWTGWTWNGKASIYLFHRDNGDLKRITNVPQRVEYLTFSRDGKYLAAGLTKGKGLSVWSVGEEFRLAGRDKKYGDKATWVDFDSKGRVVTASRDGYVRLYDNRFRLITKKKLPGGNRPFSAVFSPAGDRIAVGFADSAAVNVLSGKTLKLLYAPDTRGFNNGNLSKVAWSDDGRFLFAGGTFIGPRSKRDILRWSDQGRGSYITWASTDMKITSMRSLKNGRLAIGTLKSDLRLLNSDGSTLFEKAPQIANLGGLRKFRISLDGTSVQFGLKKNDNGNARFSLKKRKLFLDAGYRKVKLPRRKASGLTVTRWKNDVLPELNGKKLVTNKFDRSRAYAISPDERRILLGMNTSLRLFNRNGDQIWKIRAPAITRNVNISGDGRLAVAAYTDGTIHWYDLASGKELLTLFPYGGGRKWIAWTPEGFFDASPGAEELIGFHLNRGQDRTPFFVQIDQLYDSFYRPDLVMKKLMGGFDRELLEAANRIKINETLSEGGLPPIVTILSPDPGTVVSQQNVPVKICLTDQGGGSGKVIYRLNGTTLGVDDSIKRGIKGMREGLASDCDLPLSRSLNLEPGENRLTVTAYNAQNRIESRPVSIDLKFEETVSKKPDLYVIAIGINEYRDSSLKLRYSVNDAQTISRALQKSSAGLFNNINLIPLLDGDATTPGISSTFGEVSARIQPHDVFVFYVASHGIALHGTYYIIPQDLVIRNEDDIKRNAINQEMLQKWLSSVPVHKSVVLLDTCDSGTFLNAEARNLAEKTAVDKLIRATGRVIIAASASKQQALEGYEGHGVFTYVLLKALEGLADEMGNRDSLISIYEISEYVMDQVPRLTMARWGREQFPMLSLIGRSFPIGSVR